MTCTYTHTYIHTCTCTQRCYNCMYMLHVHVTWTCLHVLLNIHVVYMFICCYFFIVIRYLVNEEKDAISPKKKGTKVSPHYLLEVEGGEEVVVKLRLTNTALETEPFGPDFDIIFEDRIREADDFYRAIMPPSLGPQQMLISRQAYAGKL